MPFSRLKLRPSWGGGPVKTKLPRWIPWGDQLSTVLGGNALICAVDVAMSVESVQRSCRATKAPVTNDT